MNQSQRIELDEILSKLNEIIEAEQGKYDNAPEGLQNTDRVEKYQENAERLQEAADTIQEVKDDS